MADQAVIHFRNHDPRFLAGLTPAAAKTIVSAARQRRYMAKSVIVNQGHPAEHFFLLVSGRARYFHLSRDGRKANLRWLAPGDIFSPGGALIQSIGIPAQYGSREGFPGARAEPVTATLRSA